MRKKPLIILAGPTAVGKTALSVELARRIGGEIVSADSMQVYRGMDIGTAKVTEEEPVQEPETLKIVRNKRFEIKPMDPEEACLQMELLGHDFFVFLNAHTEAVNVVYRRRNGSYGLIEPEF